MSVHEESANSPKMPKGMESFNVRYEPLPSDKRDFGSKMRIESSIASRSVNSNELPGKKQPSSFAHSTHSVLPSVSLL